MLEQSRFAIAMVVGLFGCRPSMPVTYTLNAITEAVCAAKAAANQSQTKITKVTVETSTILAGRSGQLVNVTPVAGKATSDSPKGAISLVVEVDPTSIPCGVQGASAKRIWLNTDTGELGGQPATE